MSELNHWQRILTPVVSETPWLVAMDVVVAGGGIAQELATLGATDILIVGGSMGTGEPPEGHPFINLELPPADSMMGGIRAAEQAIDRLPQKALARIDHWDPGFSARAFRPFFSKGQPVAGRPTFGARPAAWQALEDKTVIDALWAQAGVPHAPFRVLPPERGAILDAWRALDVGQGVVLSGDSKVGFNGGASYVRWLKTPQDLDSALPLFESDCAQVRLMPFLEGIPCSIHAFVVGEQAAVFVPCEMLVLRRPSGRFVYCSTATRWVPPEPDTQAMQAIARQVALHLSRTLGYRGALTIDGVLSAQGFLPTELNPRVGAAMFPLFAGLDMPITLLHYAAIEGLDLDYRLDALQELVRRDPPRMVRAGIVLPKPLDATETRFIRTGAGGLAFCEEPEATFKVSLGPGPMGSYLAVRSIPGTVQPGAPMGPELAEILAWLDARLELGLGPLEAAQAAPHLAGGEIVGN